MTIPHIFPLLKKYFFNVTPANYFNPAKSFKQFHQNPIIILASQFPFLMIANKIKT